MTRCRVCNRELTNEISRRLGIGPDCLELAIAERPTPELLQLRAAFGGAVRQARSMADEKTGDLFEEKQHG